jgi:hypothetical protein
MPIAPTTMSEPAKPIDSQRMALVSSRIAFGYSIIVHASSAMVAIAAFTAGSIRTVTETSAPALIAVPMVACP